MPRMVMIHAVIATASATLSTPMTTHNHGLFSNQ